MFRWQDVDETTIDGMTVKMYREPLEYTEKQKIINEGFELDHYAFKNLGSEILMYQMMEANFTEYIEARGDTSRIETLYTPIKTREESF